MMELRFCTQLKDLQLLLQRALRKTSAAGCLSIRTRFNFLPTHSPKVKTLRHSLRLGYIRRWDRFSLNIHLH